MGRPGTRWNLRRSLVAYSGKTVTAIVRVTKNSKTEFVEIFKIQERDDAIDLRLLLFDED